MGCPTASMEAARARHMHGGVSNGLDPEPLQSVATTRKNRRQQDKKNRRTTRVLYPCEDAWMSAHEATIGASIASAIASTHGLAVRETIEHAVRAATSHTSIA
jgi:hypothetical protein